LSKIKNKNTALKGAAELKEKLFQKTKSLKGYFNEPFIYIHNTAEKLSSKCYNYNKDVSVLKTEGRYRVILSMFNIWDSNFVSEL